MAQKSKTVYSCENCGYENPKWCGKCPSCGEWNTMQESFVVPSAATSANKKPPSVSDVRSMRLSEISTAVSYTHLDVYKRQG